jgi:hypothetical protein
MACLRISSCAESCACAGVSEVLYDCSGIVLRPRLIVPEAWLDLPCLVWTVTCFPVGCKDLAHVIDSCGSPGILVGAAALAVARGSARLRL